MRRRVGRIGELGELGRLRLADVLGSTTDCHQLAGLVLEIPAAEDLGPVLRDHPDPVRRRVWNRHVLLTPRASEKRDPEHDCLRRYRHRGPPFGGLSTQFQATASIARLRLPSRPRGVRAPCHRTWRSPAFRVSLRRSSARHHATPRATHGGPLSRPDQVG